MKNQIKYPVIFLLLFIVACTNNDNFDETLVLSPKSVTDCDLNPTALVALCINGAEYALPNEIITYAAKFNSVNAVFTWTIESGDMEIINIEESIENGNKKSIATIKFNRNFTGDGLFNVKAQDQLGLANMDHRVELQIEENQ